MDDIITHFQTDVWNLPKRSPQFAGSTSRAYTSCSAISPSKIAALGSLVVTTLIKRTGDRFSENLDFLLKVVLSSSRFPSTVHDYFLPDPDVIKISETYCSVFCVCLLMLKQ